MILISVYPVHVKSIRERRKKYEFRKLSSRKAINNIKKDRFIAIYETKPVCAITAVFEVGELVFNQVNVLWERFGKKSGITKEYFMNYFRGKGFGMAIRIKRFRSLRKPITISEIKREYPHFRAPQNFYYLSDKKFPWIYKTLSRLIYFRKP